MIRKFDGASWIDTQSWKRFDGTNWVDVSVIQRFDGSNWIDLNISQYVLSPDGVTTLDEPAGSVYLPNGSEFDFDLKLSSSMQVIRVMKQGSFQNTDITLTTSERLTSSSSWTGIYATGLIGDGTADTIATTFSNGTVSRTLPNTYIAVGILIDCNPGYTISGKVSAVSIDGIDYTFSI